MARSDRDCSLVTSEDGGAKGRSMISGVLCDLVLCKPCLTSRQANIYPNFTYRLPLQRFFVFIFSGFPTLDVLFGKFALISFSNLQFFD